jgi:hypothetical protein
MLLNIGRLPPVRYARTSNTEIVGFRGSDGARTLDGT